MGLSYSSGSCGYCALPSTRLQDTVAQASGEEVAHRGFLGKGLLGEYWRAFPFRNILNQAFIDKHLFLISSLRLIRELRTFSTLSVSKIGQKEQAERDTFHWGKLVQTMVQEVGCDKVKFYFSRSILSSSMK